MSDTNSNNDIYAVVLAAGTSSRFGTSKQLAEIRGVPLVRRAVASANAACGDHTVLVVGHDRNAVVTACGPMQGYFLVNDDFEVGLGSSVARAIASLQHTARAVIVILADQVRITPEHLSAISSTWSGADDEIVATGYSGSRGAPVLFPRGCFDDLLALSGDTGGQHLLFDDRFRVREVLFEAAAVDIDTPEDLIQHVHSAHN